MKGPGGSKGFSAPLQTKPWGRAVRAGRQASWRTWDANVSLVSELGDDLGPAKVIHVNNSGLGLKGILVVDNVAIGPSIGGLRMAPDVSLEECARLARAMTLKN